MVVLGLNDEGTPGYPLQKLENGFVVPDVSLKEVHEIHRRQTELQIQRGIYAETFGYNYVLHPEHHFTPLGGSSPHPILTQTAIASRTDEIQLVQMANILPWHDPIRVAEQTAMLDVISDGRIGVGIGTGFGAREGETLGQYWGGTQQDKNKNWRSFEEKYNVLLQAWTEDSINHHGQFHDIPPTYVEWENSQEYFYLNDDVCDQEPTDFMDTDTESTILQSISVFPQPQQEPHPQLWKPVMSPESVKWVARQGINGCTHCTDFSELKDRIDLYHETAKEADWPDHRSKYDGEPFDRGWDERRSRGIVAILQVFNTEIADTETIDRWKLSLEFRQSSKKAMLPPEKAKKIAIDSEEALATLEKEQNPIVGTTEEIIDQIAAFKKICGYEDLILFINPKVVGISHDETIEQMRAFAEDVVPYFEEQSTN